MKLILYIFTLTIALTSSSCLGQTDATKSTQKYAHQLLTIEPAVGIHTNFGTDLLLSYSGSVESQGATRVRFALVL